MRLRHFVIFKYTVLRLLLKAKAKCSIIFKTRKEVKAAAEERSRTGAKPEEL